MGCSLSWMASRDTIRSRWRSRTKKRLLSSLNRELSVTKFCPSASAGATHQRAMTAIYLPWSYGRHRWRWRWWHPCQIKDCKSAYSTPGEDRSAIIAASAAPQKCVFGVSSGKLLGFLVRVSSRSRYAPSSTCHHRAISRSYEAYSDNYCPFFISKASTRCEFMNQLLD